MSDASILVLMREEDRAIFKSIDTSLQSIAQSLRAQTETQAEALQALQALQRHFNPRPARIVKVSRATYAGEETGEFEQRREATSVLGKDKDRGEGGVPGFRRR